MTEEHLRQEVNRLNNVIAERDWKIRELQSDHLLLTVELEAKKRLISLMKEKLGILASLDPKE